MLAHSIIIKYAVICFSRPDKESRCRNETRILERIVLIEEK